MYAIYLEDEFARMHEQARKAIIQPEQFRTTYKMFSYIT